MGGRADLHTCWRSPRPPTTAKTRPPSRAGERDAVLRPQLRGAVGRELLGLRAPQADQGGPQGRPRRRPRPGRPADARRRACGAPAGPGSGFTTHPDPAAVRAPDLVQPRLHRHPPEREVGGGLHVLLDVVRDRLRRVRHRRVLAPHRRLEGVPVDDRPAGRRRVEHGRLDPARRRHRRADLPLRRRQSIRVHRLHRPPRRHRRRALDRHRRRQLR